MLKNLAIDLTDSFEKIPVKIYPTPPEGSKYVAAIIADCIREKQQNGEPIVLGLATGSTPISMYNRCAAAVCLRAPAPKPGLQQTLQLSAPSCPRPLK